MGSKTRLLGRAVALTALPAITVSLALPAHAGAARGTATRTASGVFVPGDAYNSQLTMNATSSTDTTGSTAVNTNKAVVHLSQVYCDTSGGIDYLNDVELDGSATNAKGQNQQILPGGAQTADIDLDLPQMTLSGTITSTPMQKYTNCEVQAGPADTFDYSTTADIETSFVKDPSATPSSNDDLTTHTFTWSRGALSGKPFELDIKDESLDDDVATVQSGATLSLVSTTTDGSDPAKLYPIKN